MNHKILVLIPARYESSRFPGKPLAAVSGKSLIQRVTENCMNSELSGVEVAVVTNNDQIESHLKNLSLPVVRVDDDVISGTERIALAKQRFFADKKWDFVINLQGDEPLFTGKLLKEFIEYSLSHNFDITTLLRPKSGREGFDNPNIVKCAYEVEQSRCLYFSRTSIPYSESKEVNWYQHIGIYGFKDEALDRFLGLPESELEKQERLEQLRALSHGMTIGALETCDMLVGVDRPEDVKEVEEILKNKNMV